MAYLPISAAEWEKAKPTRDMSELHFIEAALLKKVGKSDMPDLRGCVTSTCYETLMNPDPKCRPMPAAFFMNPGLPTDAEKKASQEAYAKAYAKGLVSLATVRLPAHTLLLASIPLAHMVLPEHVDKQKAYVDAIGGPEVFSFAAAPTLAKGLRDRGHLVNDKGEVEDLEKLRCDRPSNFVQLVTMCRQSKLDLQQTFMNLTRDQCGCLTGCMDPSPVLHVEIPRGAVSPEHGISAVLHDIFESAGMVLLDHYAHVKGLKQLPVLAYNRPSSLKEDEDLFFHVRYLGTRKVIDEDSVFDVAHLFLQIQTRVSLVKSKHKHLRKLVDWSQKPHSGQEWASRKFLWRDNKIDILPAEYTISMKDMEEAEKEYKEKLEREANMTEEEKAAAAAEAAAKAEAEDPQRALDAAFISMREYAGKMAEKADVVPAPIAPEKKKDDTSDEEDE